MDDMLKTYEEDVRDALAAVTQSEADLLEAVKWHQGCLVRYFSDMKRLDDYKKDNNL